MLGAIALLLLSVAESVVLMVLAWSLVQLALNAAWAGGVAAVPDQVPAERRGLIGGLVAIAGTVGVLLGIKIAELTGRSPRATSSSPRDAGAVGALPRRLA